MIEDKNQERTPLSNFGEFKLISHLTKNFTPKHPTTLKGIGDDAAVLAVGNSQMLVSTDLLVEGVHFDLAYMPLKHLGYKSVVVNLSDIYAMNAKPTHITFSMAVSNRFSVEALEELYAGIALACKSYDIDLIGGDTTSSLKGLTISVTALGQAEAEKIVYRHGAKPTDLLVVTGDLGAAYLGLQILERERQVFKVNPNNQPDLDPYTYLIERQLKPEAGKHIYEALKGLEVVPTAMIDISDGLSSEILHLCKSSNVGCCVYEAKIPIDTKAISTCEEFRLNPVTVALSGGEDYELLFTISQKDYPKVKNNPMFTVIGYMTESLDACLVTSDQERIPLQAQGWNALRETDA